MVLLVYGGCVCVVPYSVSVWGYFFSLFVPVVSSASWLLLVIGRLWCWALVHGLLYLCWLNLVGSFSWLFLVGFVLEEHFFAPIALLPIGFWFEPLLGNSVLLPLGKVFERC